MKEKNTSGNLFSMKEDVDSFSFTEEFDSSHIANRGEGVDALSVNDFVEKEFDHHKKVLSDQDVLEIAKQGEDAKKAANLYAALTDKEETESSIIKSEDAEKIDDIYNLYDNEHTTEIEKDYAEEEDSDSEPDSDLLDNDISEDDMEYEDTEEENEDEEEDYDSIKHLLSEEEKQKYIKKHKPKPSASYEDIKKKKIEEQAEFEKTLFDALYSKEYKESDEYKDMIFLEKQFDGIVKAPLIEFKNNASIQSNLLEPDELKKDKKFIEITQAISIDNAENIHETSSVEITRDKNGEIENIVVVCKCGEKTLIKFDYNDNEEQTINDKTKTSDYNMENIGESEESESEEGISEEDISSESDDLLEFAEHDFSDDNPDFSDMDENIDEDIDENEDITDIDTN